MAFWLLPCLFNDIEDAAAVSDAKLPIDIAHMVFCRALCNRELVTQALNRSSSDEKLQNLRFTSGEAGCVCDKAASLCSGELVLPIGMVLLRWEGAHVELLQVDLSKNDSTCKYQRRKANRNGGECRFAVQRDGRWLGGKSMHSG